MREARAGEKLKTLDGEERELVKRVTSWITVADKTSGPCSRHGWRGHRVSENLLVLSLKQLSSMAIDPEDSWSPQFSF